MHLDANGYPWIIYIKGLDPTWTFYHVRWNGSSWTSPETIVATDNQFNYCDFIIHSTTDIECYLTATGQAGRGGDIEKWNWNGSSWSKVATVFTETASGYALNNPVIPVNHDTVGLVFSEVKADEYVTLLKVYAYGLPLVTTKTYSADILFKKLNIPATYSVDTVLKQMGITKTFLIDVLLQKLGLTKSYGIDAYFGSSAVSYIRSYLIDVLLKKLGVTQTYSIDALLKKLSLTKAYSVDVDFKKAFTETYGIDVDLRKTITKTYSLDVLLNKLNIAKSYGIDAIFGASFNVYTKNYFIDLVLKKLGLTKSYAIDTLLKKLGLTQTYSLDAIFVFRFSKTYTIDSLLKKPNLLNTYNIDAYFGTFMFALETFPLTLECDDGTINLETDDENMILYG
jgi:antitoxin component of RelBE/YafQ-DinJ toxin-antitoxin module